MDIYIYTDESGVFDRDHNKFFVYGGILFLSFEEKEIFTRKYIHAEHSLRKDKKYKEINELKASHLDNKDKGKLFRSTNQCYRFGTVIHEQKLLSQAFENKKSKQRYLDYAFKIGLKRYLEHLVNNCVINPNNVVNLHLYCDQHSTATNGFYELQESIFNEFRNGIYSYRYNTFHSPIMPKLESVEIKYCDSLNTTLIRSADIIANRIYYFAQFEPDRLIKDDHFFITTLP